MKLNPFQPNSPVHPGMFIGRISEIQKLNQALYQTKMGQPVNCLITGERGIGKTSLLELFRDIAKGLIEVEEGVRFNFLVVNTDISSETNRLDLIQKIELSLRSELSETEAARTFFSDTWSFIRKFEVGGVAYKPEDKRNYSTEVLFEEFSLSLKKTLMRLCEAGEDLFSAKYEGILLIIDEADSASSDLNLGVFVKMLCEKLERHGCTKFMIGMAGLPDVLNALRASHESSLRLFNVINVGRLTNTEIEKVVDRCLTKANDVNSEKVSITPEGINALVTVSEGYPHFIQQFGHTAFAADTDNSISEADVGSGVMESLRLIGESYYKDDFYNKIQVEDYRQVLRIMAEKLDNWVLKREIKAKFKGRDTILNNAISALINRNIIIACEGVRGKYRLANKGFAIWIKHCTKPEG